MWFGRFLPLPGLANARSVTIKAPCHTQPSQKRDAHVSYPRRIASFPGDGGAGCLGASMDPCHMHQPESMPPCETCHGSGECPTEYGPIDCPDCGGAGQLPTKKLTIELRTSDIERAYAGARNTVASDVRWLLAELRRARSALTEIVALAHDVQDDSAIALRIRITANRALGLYPAEARRTPPSLPEE